MFTSALWWIAINTQQCRYVNNQHKALFGLQPRRSPVVWTTTNTKHSVFHEARHLRDMSITVAAQQNYLWPKNNNKNQRNIFQPFLTGYTTYRNTSTHQPDNTK